MPKTDAEWQAENDALTAKIEALKASAVSDPESLSGIKNSRDALKAEKLKVQAELATLKEAIAEKEKAGLLENAEFQQLFEAETAQTKKLKEELDTVKKKTTFSQAAFKAGVSPAYVDYIFSTQNDNLNIDGTPKDQTLFDTLKTASPAFFNTQEAAARIATDGSKTHLTGTTQTVFTRDAINKMSMEDYKKYAKDIDKAAAAGLVQ